MTNDSTDLRLRPVKESDLAIMERIDTDPAMSEPFEWRGFSDAGRHRRRWEEDGYLGPTNSLLIVALGNDEFAGLVSWRAISASGPQGCVEIGILLLPDHRGQGHGTVAQRLLADYLFSTTTIHRLEATTEVDNVAEQRALEHAGFVREGMLKGRGFVRGQWRDGYMYARLRDDHPADR